MKTIEQYAIRRNFSGLRAFDDGGSSVDSYSYARRLASYLRDPSTIRVRTMEKFGSSPSKDQIQRMIARRQVVPRLGPPKPVKAQKFVIKSEPYTVLRPTSKPVHMKTSKEVIASCARYFYLTYDDIIGPSRNAYASWPRQMVFAILRSRGNSLSNIGRYMGGKDHTTVMHGIRQFFKRNIKDPKYEKAWMKLAPCKFKMVRTLEEFEMMM